MDENAPKQGLLDSKEYKEYMQAGGHFGLVKRDFQNEIKKALTDEKHFLHKYIKTRQKRHNKKADELILSIMMGALHDNTHPLHWCAFWLIQTPHAMAGAQRAMELLPPEAYPETFHELAHLGYMNLLGAQQAVRKNTGKGGSMKGKNNKERILPEWKKYSSKEKGAQAFAELLFKKWGGSYDENGKTNKGVPSVKIIAKTVRDYIRTSQRNPRNPG